MMFLYKSLHQDGNNQGSRQDLSSYYKLFGFHARANKDQLSAIKKLAEDNQKAIGDVIASQTANLYAEEILKRDKFVTESLRCCRDLSIDLGYDEIDVQKIIELGKSVSSNIVLTAGCQTEELLESRVRATENLCYELALARCNVNVVFSGNNPKKDARVKIQNESQRMNTLFWQKWEKRKDVDLRKKLLVEILTEEEATQSSQNVERFVSKKANSLTKIPSNVFVVSSSFHIARLSIELEKSLKLLPNSKVEKIILIGSESVDSPNRISMHNAYVKTMIFEIYRHLLIREDFWK